jgi:hypothetical protein
MGSPVDPVLSIPRPDVEFHVHQAIKPLGGTTTWAYAVIDLEPPGWLTSASIQVDVRASSMREAFTRADAARRIIHSLPTQPWADGQVNRVDTIDGPFWMPEATGAPRYVARYRVIFHPARLRR